MKRYQGPDGRRLPTVCVDFDGVLVGPDMEALPGAVQWLEGLLRAGVKVTVLSARAHSPAQRIWIEQWLCKRGPFGSIRATNQKPVADLYVDDRAWRFEGIFPSLEEVGSSCES